MKGIIFCLSLVATTWAAGESFRDSKMTKLTPTEQESSISSPLKAKRNPKEAVYIPNIELINEGDKTKVNFLPKGGVELHLQPELMSHLRHIVSTNDITIGKKNVTKEVHDLIKGLWNGTVTTDKNNFVTDLVDILDQLFDAIKVPDLFRPFKDAIGNVLISLGGGLFGPLISFISSMAIYILPPIALVAALLSVVAIALVAAFVIGEVASGPEIWDSDIYEAFVSPTNEFQGGFNNGGGGFNNGGVGGFNNGGVGGFNNGGVGGFNNGGVGGFNNGGVRGFNDGGVRGFNDGGVGGFNDGLGGLMTLAGNNNFNGNRRSSYSSYNRRSDDLSSTPILLTKTGSESDHMWNTIDGSASSIDRNHRSLNGRSHVARPLLNRILHNVVDSVHKYQKMYEDYQE